MAKILGEWPNEKSEYELKLELAKDCMMAIPNINNAKVYVEHGDAHINACKVKHTLMYTKGKGFVGTPDLKLLQDHVKQLYLIIRSLASLVKSISDMTKLAPLQTITTEGDEENHE